jgi:hypothetical protein
MNSLIFTGSDDRWLVGCHLSSWGLCFLSKEWRIFGDSHDHFKKLEHASVGLQINRMP